MVTTVAGIDLSPRDESYLRGERGEGAALAMRVLLKVGRAMGATRLVDVESAHVDGCIYIGSVSLHFARKLAEGGAKVSVPTTLNIGAIDLLHPELWHGDAETARNARALMDVYASLGCRPTCNA